MPDPAMQRLLRALHVSCEAGVRASPSASLILGSLGLWKRIRTCTLIFLAAAILSAKGEPPSDIAKKAFTSTVMIVIEDDQGRPISLGSGFVISNHAIVTNMHVIEGAFQGYAKQIGSETRHKLAGILRADTIHDLAVLAVPSLSAPALPIGDSSQLAVGNTIYAVGNPEGLEGTFSEGIISSIRSINSQIMLQITAPISHGSSGGAVLNERGEVVGVAVATFTDGQNLNFAIPSSYLTGIKLAANPSPLATAPRLATSEPIPSRGDTPAATPYKRSSPTAPPIAKAGPTAEKLFEELRVTGGYNHGAEAVCYPSSEDQNNVFILVAFSNHIASTMSAKGERVPEAFLEAEKAPESERFLLQWAFKDGVQVHNDPEVFEAVVGSGGRMWSADVTPANSKKRFTAQMVFSESGRYRRDVLVDGRVVVSVPGRFEPIR